MPPTTDALGQYQPAGNNETPIAGEDLNTDAIVDAQLTHLISRDDALQGQDVNTIHPEPEIHEQIYMTKRLRNNVYNYKHILTYIERTVNNTVNDAMHVDAHKMQT